MVRGTESATSWAEAFGENLDLGTQRSQCVGVAEAILVDRLVHDTYAVGLREGSDKRGLPIGHESGVNVGFQSKWTKHAASSTEREGVTLGIDGEVAAGPVPAAVSNALYRAIGIRARHLPLTIERVTQLVWDAQ